MLWCLHRRDEEDGLLPAVDRGPPRGLLDAAVEAVDAGGTMPFLHQLPTNLVYAAEACRLLAAHPLTAGQVPGWIERNLRAARAPVCGRRLVRLPLRGCRTYEDVRNRILVDLDQLTAEDLARLDDVVRRAERREPG